MPLSERIDQLQTAVVHCTIGRLVRRSARWSLFLGVLALGIGIGTSVFHDYVTIALGGALIAEGTYLVLSHRPVTVLIQGTTLALLSLWSVAGLVTHYLAHRGLGNPVGAVLLALGAANMFSTYRTYKVVTETADPEAVRICREELKKIGERSSNDVVFLGLEKKLVAEDAWAAGFLDDVVLFVTGPRKAFRDSIQVTSAAWMPRRSVRIENTGSGWVGTKTTVHLYRDDLRFATVKIASEDLDRLQNMVLSGPPIHDVG